MSKRDSNSAIRMPPKSHSSSLILLRILALVGVNPKLKNCSYSLDSLPIPLMLNSLLHRLLFDSVSTHDQSNLRNDRSSDATLHTNSEP